MNPQAPAAVDLFFILSGFVLSKTYDERFEAELTVFQFMKQRYIRLYPLFFIGLSIGIISAISALAVGRGSLSLRDFILAAFSGMLALPSPTWSSIADLVPLDKPAWSLIFELFINLIFALTWRHIKGSALVILVAVSGLALASLHFISDGFAGPAWPDLWMGIVRVVFGFYLGVMIARHVDPVSFKTDWAWIIPLILIPAFYLMPDTSRGHGFGVVLPDILFVFLVCPILIIVGAIVEPLDTRFMTALGIVSYPLYVIHEPAMFLAWRVLLVLHISPTNAAPLSGVIFAAGMVVLAYLLGAADLSIRDKINRARRLSKVTARAMH